MIGMSLTADESGVCSEVSYPSLSAVATLIHSFAAGFTEALQAPKHMPQVPATQARLVKVVHDVVGGEATPLFPFEES